MFCLYGSDAVTPNLHLHHHLYDSVRDFGPVYAFWLFGFCGILDPSKLLEET